jgi:hypothetical protein
MQDMAVTSIEQHALEIVKPVFWDWFNAHRDDVVIRRKVLVVSVVVRVRDLEPLFRKIFT